MNCSVAIGSYRGTGNGNRTIKFDEYNVQAILVENNLLGTRYSGTMSPTRPSGGLAFRNYPIWDTNNNDALSINANGSLVISNILFNLDGRNYLYLLFYIP